MLGLFSEPEDYEERIDGFKQVAEDFHWREDMAFGIIIDKALIKEMDLKYSGYLFQKDEGLNSIVFWKNRNLFEFKD